VHNRNGTATDGGNPVGQPVGHPVGHPVGRLGAAPELHPWRRWDDGRLWPSIYLTRTLMLVVLAAASLVVDAPWVTMFVAGVVIPYNLAMQFWHRRYGRPCPFISADQILAASCTIISPKVAIGAAICLVAGTTTGSIGLRRRWAQTSLAVATIVMFAAGVYHDDLPTMAFALPTGISGVAFSNLIAYLFNKRQAAHGRYEELLDSMQAVVLEADTTTGEVVYANKMAERVFGLGTHSKTSQTASSALLEVIHPDDRERVRTSITRALSTRLPITMELRLREGEGYIDMEQRTTFAEVRGRVRIRSVLFDVSSRKRVEMEMAHRAFHDALTDLPNRALLNDRIEHAIARGTRVDGEHAILLLDLDNFKDVNDALGHQSGDALLVEITRRLRSIMRSSDTLARFGGDEFVVLLEDTQLGMATEIAARISTVVGQAFDVGGSSLYPRASIGIARWPVHATSGDDLLRLADIAMYDAKRSRSGYAVYDPSMNPDAARKLALLAEFRTAIATDQLRAYFQPIVQFNTSQVISCEALVRWQHPVHGLLAPAEFLPAVASGGLSSDLARWMLTNAMERIRQLHSRGVELSVSVNLSALDLANNELVSWLIATAERHGFPIHLLTLELTETELLSYGGRAFGALERLQQAGITTAVDDFGTGYSSLVWLRDLPVRTLKIDRSFVASLCSDQRAAAIVSSTIQMARSLDLAVVAEGVEDLETAKALDGLGCTTLQGYLYGRPVPFEEFEIVLHELGRADVLAATPAE
jgi:diguanylate cyclase (GGDEF)-like protein/PAS domain S-box-containing protein